MQTAVQTWRGSCCCRCLKWLNRERLFSTWSLLLFAELSRRTKSTESKARLLWEQVIGFSDEHDLRSRALIRESSEFSTETFRNNSETLGGAARFRAPFCGTDLRNLVRAVDLETTGIRLQALGSTTSKSFWGCSFQWGLCTPGHCHPLRGLCPHQVWTTQEKRCGFKAERKIV